jgi:hypothetical protein
MPKTAFNANRSVTESLNLMFLARMYTEVHLCMFVPSLVGPRMRSSNRYRNETSGRIRS